MKFREIVVAFVFLFVVALPGVSLAADPTAVFTVDAPKDEVYAASIAALTVMEFDIQRENEKVGMIAAQNENKWGEWNNKIVIMMTEKDGVTEIQFTGQKRRFSMGGDSPQERARQFREALQARLDGKNIVEVAKNARR